MIKELLDLRKDAELRGDVAVVGSGLAGTEAARTLAARGLRVVLLESGRRAFDGRLQLLNEVVHAGKRLFPWRRLS